MQVNAIMALRLLYSSEMQQAIAAADGDAQAGWDRALAAYLDGDISLARAAGLLGLSRFELAGRFQRLGLPLQIGEESGTYYPLTAGDHGLLAGRCLP